MVTQQILVLSFWVRIPAAQPNRTENQCGIFFVSLNVKYFPYTRNVD